MIFRRLKAHVEKENWFAVFIDFAIVVVGVFIGIQVGNWNDRRLEAEAYQQSYARVIEELESNLRRQKFLREGVKKELPIIQTALENLRVCKTDEAAMAEFDAALPVLSSPYTLLFRPDRLNQHIERWAGYLGQPEDHRRIFENLSGQFEFYQKEADVYGSSIQRSFMDLPDIVGLSAVQVESPDDILEVILSEEPLSPPQYRKAELVVPPEQACQNRALLGAFYDWESEAVRLSIRAGIIEAFIEKALKELGHTHAIDRGQAVAQSDEDEERVPD